MVGQRTTNVIGDALVPTGDAQRLAYFPEAFPEEIMYSVFARCLLHLAGPGRKYTSSLLFGVARRRSRINSSSGLGYIQARLSKTHAFDARAMLLGHTNFPYYAVFMRPSQKEAAIAARIEPPSSPMAARVTGTKRLWYAAEAKLRFCPDCLSEMQEKHGELYWRRDHQIPTVLVCPLHGSVLRTASTPAILGNGYYPATAVTCPSNAAPVLEAMTERERETLHIIAIRSAALLQRDATLVSNVTDLEEFRHQMRMKGLLNKNILRKAHVLKDALLVEFGHLERVWPDIFNKTDVRGSGALNRVGVAGARYCDPLVHVLLAILLDRLPDVLEPFGRGPWTCPNPLASHATTRPVREVSFRRDRLPLITAHFTCECGYAFTRTAHPDGSVTDPKYKSFGSTLLPLLIEAGANGWSLCRTALAAGISTKAVKTQVRVLGLANPWPKGRDWRDNHRRQRSNPSSS